MEQPSTPPSSPTNYVVENMRCIKCKDKTGNIDIEQTVSAKNRARIKAKCEKCGSIKTRFGSIDKPINPTQPKKEKEIKPKTKKDKKDKITTYVNIDDLPAYFADLIKLYNK